MRKLVMAFFGLLLAVAPVAAQDYKPVDFNFGFGWMFPSGDFKDDGFSAGWNGTFGVTFNLSEHLGVQAEYIYGRMDGPSKTILVSQTPVAGAITNGLIESNHQMHVGSFNLVYRAVGQDHPLGWYGLAGLGIYHRIIQLTSPSVGYTTICDPYWYVCYPAAVSIDTILGDRSSNDFGIDFGAGITFGRQAKFYIESRYHYVWGPEITAGSNLPAGTTTPCSGGCTTNFTYYPLTLGVRF